MTCRDYENEIQEFLDGELPDERVDELQNHCMHCPDCADYLRRMNALHEELRTLRDEPVPQGLHQGIMESLRREKRGSPLIRFMRRPAAAVAAVVVLLIGTVAAVNTIGGRNAASEAAMLTEMSESEDGAKSALGSKAETTAAMKATTAVTYAATAALDTEIAGSGETSGTAAEESEESAETLQERARARACIPEITADRPYAFVQVIRTDTVPQSFTDWTAQDVRFDGEDVTVLIAYVTRARAQNIAESAEASWTYFCDDAEIWPALTETAQEGLILVIVPQGT